MASSPFMVAVFLFKCCILFFRLTMHTVTMMRITTTAASTPSTANTAAIVGIDELEFRPAATTIF